MKNNNIHAVISEKVRKAKAGTVFTTADFATLACINTVRQSLFRLVNQGILRRLFPGVFEKPRFSKLLQENVVADPMKVAEALAKCFHWTIAPSGNTALNMLGLSTQVPVVWSFVSDGPYKVYEWEDACIVFKHRCNRELSGLSMMSRLVVHALKAKGKVHVSDKDVRKLSGELRPVDKRKLLKECSACSDWIYQIIRQVCA